MQNSMVMLTFSVLDHKYFLGANLFQKLEIVSVSWKLAPRLIGICRIQWWCSFFLFKTGNAFLGKFGLKNQNCQFGLIFGTYTDSNMFWPKISFGVLMLRD